MYKFISVIAVAVTVCGLGGCSPHMTTTPASSTGPVGAPVNAPPYECVTDDGYGRWQPCGNMS